MKPHRSVFATTSLLCTTLLLAAANCQQCQAVTSPRRGNVDRVTDAVLVTGSDKHSYAILANPELEHLRVLDLTAEKFTASQNKYFPVSIPVGAQVARLVVSSKRPAHVFALNVADNSVVVVGTPAAKTAQRLLVQKVLSLSDNAIVDVAVTAAGDDAGYDLWLLSDEQIEMVHLSTTFEALDPVVVALPAGALPMAMAVDPSERTLLVSDGVGTRVHVVDVATQALVESIDVGGPQAALSIGSVALPDGDAPVALLARRDDTLVVAVRLWREGYREPRDQVLGSVDVGALATATYVPDFSNDTEPTVCCRGLDSASIEAFEATAAWGAVAAADGRVHYVALAAKNPDGAGTLVRLIDDDAEGLAPQTVALDDDGNDNLWVSGDDGDAGDGDARRPIGPIINPVLSTGDPPLVDQVQNDETLLLEWEGSPPGLSNVTATFAGGVIDAVSVDWAVRGARVGDGVRLDVDEACGDTIESSIAAIDGNALHLADVVDEECLLAHATFAVRVSVAQAFAVTDAEGQALPRLALLPPGFDAATDTLPPDGELVLPGGVLTLEQSAAGLPYPKSKLAVPLDPHVVAMGLDMADAVGTTGSGGFGQAGYVMTRIVGGRIRYPNPADTTKTINARRMLITTGSNETASGLNVVFSCDEAETNPALCDAYR